MTRPTKLVIDCSTGLDSVVELTDEEIAQREVDAANYATEQAARVAAAEALAALKSSAKAKLVAGEPLTEAEAATIVL